MPLLPPIILSKPNLLVSKTDIGPNGETSQSADFVYGYVEMIYDTCDDVVVGQYVLFQLSIARALLYGSTIYYIINEQHKLFKEVPL